jgi:hypothetical protein
MEMGNWRRQDRRRRGLLAKTGLLGLVEDLMAVV